MSDQWYIRRFEPKMPNDKLLLAPLHTTCQLQTYRCKCKHTLTNIQWDLSITDTLGTEKQFVIQRFPLFRGYFIRPAIYLVPQKQSVIERFSLLGEFVKRGSAVLIYEYTYSGTCIIRHPLGNEKQCWISRLLDYRGQFVW